VQSLIKQAVADSGYEQKRLLHFRLHHYCCLVLSTKLEDSTLFVGENRWHGTDGRTDGQGATLNAVPYGKPLNNNL